MSKDWTGGNASVFKTIGASNHCASPRQDDDYYATDPHAVELLLGLEKFNPSVWEPACGCGHISEVLQAHGYNVRSTDLVNRGYGEVMDFLNTEPTPWHGDIITNPPYKFAREFVERSLQVVDEGCKVAMFLKLTFLEGKGRRALFEANPPLRVWVSSSRLMCAPNGDFSKLQGSATAYAWFVWQKGYNGDTVVKWFN